MDGSEIPPCSLTMQTINLFLLVTSSSVPFPKMLILSAKLSILSTIFEENKGPVSHKREKILDSRQKEAKGYLYKKGHQTKTTQLLRPSIVFHTHAAGALADTTTLSLRKRKRKRYL